MDSWCRLNAVLIEGVTWTALVAGSLARGWAGLRDLHTLARWPVRLHRWHTSWKAGHCRRPPGWKPEPHPGHLWPPWLLPVSWCCRRTACMEVSGVALANSALWRLAASCARHLLTVVSRVRFFSLSKSSTVSPSARPEMIWSRIFFCVQASSQKLQVFASSRRETRKSSKVSPSCCVRDLKARLSTDSLICPLTYASMAVTISLTLFRCSSVRPKLSTMVSVSREKHRVSAWTCFSPSWVFKPDRLKYACHCFFQALKSVPLSTWRSSFGKSPCLKTYVISLSFLGF
jgi:hypothetical protein